MSKVVRILKGLPASGKSTYAKKLIADEPNRWKRINKDDLRMTFDNSFWSKENEKFVIKMESMIMLEALKDGKGVIIDNTSLAPKHEERVRQLITQYNKEDNDNVSVEVMFFDVPIDECIKRDLKRPASVGEKVIRNMYNQFLKKTQVYVEDKSLPRILIVDMDGTLALMNGKRSPFEWKRVGEDDVNEPVRKVVNAYEGYKVIVMSGRDEICRQETIDWLNKNNVVFDDIFMRPQGNSEKDSIIKRRLFDEHIRGKYYVDLVLDDRDSVVDLWRNMGLTCFQVAYGDF